MYNKDEFVKFCVTNGIRLSVALSVYKLLNFNTELPDLGIRNGVVSKLALGTTALVIGAMVPNDICDKIRNWLIETPEDYR